MCTRQCSCAAAAAGGNCKVQARHLSGGAQLCETPQRGFRLARSGLRLEDDEPRSRLHGSDDGLRGSWRFASEVAKVHCVGSARRSVAKADHGSGVLRTRMGGLVVVEAQRIHVVEEPGIGADPVRECCKPCNEVMKPGLIRKGSPSWLEGRLEPAPQGGPHLVRFITPVVVVYAWFDPSPAM